jgi:hypothetical protein
VVSRVEWECVVMHVSGGLLVLHVGLSFRWLMDQWNNRQRKEGRKKDRQHGSVEKGSIDQTNHAISVSLFNF